MPTFGPGTLTIGATGTELDVSCFINSCKISPSNDQGDSKTYLCGTSKPGALTTTYALTGNLDVDSEDAQGLLALSWAEPGSEQPFTFVPNSDTETTATGVVIITPLDFGGDEYGSDMASDFEWQCVGKPDLTWPTTDGTQAELRARRFDRRVINGAPGAGQKVTSEYAAKPTAKKAKAEKATA